MDERALRELLTPGGLRLLDEVSAATGERDPVSAVSALRAAGHSPELVSAVLTQARLRERAAAKFGPFAERMLFTEAGLEQATRLRVAALHAGRLAGAGMTSVADLGCGIGGDAMAMASLELRVSAVERDPVTAAIASYNLAPFPNASVERGTAEDADLDGIDAVWLDPARREGARRFSDPADWSPSLDAVMSIAETRPVGVKLAPGLDRALLPAGWEAQWISDDRETVETVLWSEGLARAGIGRAATVLSSAGRAELVGEGDAADAEAGELGGWLYEPDGAVIRARLIGDLARSLDGRMLDPAIAWITADEAVDTPFAQRFAVEAELPLDARTLRRELRAREIGTVEIKKRGVDIDPAAFRARLQPRGEGSATLILTRRAGRRIAVLAQRR